MFLRSLFTSICAKALPLKYEICRFFLVVWITRIRMVVQMMNWEESGWKWSWDITQINLDEESEFENGKHP